MDISYEGSYYDGQTPERHPVYVGVGPDGLEVQFEDQASEWWMYDDIRQTQGGYRGEPARFERGEGITEVLVVDDPEILNAIRQYAPLVAARFHSPDVRRRRARIIATVAIVGLVLAIALYTKGVPLLAQFVAARVPVTWEEQLGAAVVGELADPRSVCADSLVLESLNRMVERLDEAAPTPYTWNVQVVRDDLVNAFALPGGYVVVFSGLLEQSDRPEEVAGVLAHEMEHVVNRHGTKTLLRQLPLNFLLGAFTGDATAWTRAVSTVANVGMLSYRRNDEQEADLEGVDRLQAAHVDPQGLVAFFETLQEEGTDAPRLLSYLSTHPDTEARIAAIEARIGASRDVSPPEPLLPDVDWAAVRTACAPPQDDESPEP